MKRDLEALASQEFDLVVVGGGVAGISVARDAALRGLSVALLERDDFAAGSSGQTLGMVHGGLRSLQRLDLGRMRALSRERNTLLRNAPHLVRPVPVAVPTYGMGRNGRPALNAGLGLYQLLTPGRNQGIKDPARRLASSRTIDRTAVMEMFPGLPDDDATGAVIFSDGQMEHAPRLAVAMARSAAAAGAHIANGLEVTGIVRKGITVTGVGVRTTQEVDSFVVRGRMVVNTTGAWSGRILREVLGVDLDPSPAFARKISFVVNRRPVHKMGLALLDPSRRSGTALSRSSHHLFILPWRDRTVMGEWYRDYRGDPDAVGVTDEEVETLIGEVNESYPGLRLHPDEIVRRNVSLGLMERSRNPNKTAGPRLVDHAVVHGIRGIVSLLGSTWETSRMDAQRVVDEACRRLGASTSASSTSHAPVHGGDFESFGTLVQEIHDEAREFGIDRERAQALARSHGTGFRDVLRLVQEDRSLAVPLPGQGLLRAEVVHAARSEMALTLADVVHRRTELGTATRPRADMEEAADLMAAEFEWSPSRARRELASAMASDPEAIPPVAPVVRP
jgi:glycerol-3-phosphate dehydrogenase